MGKNKSNDPLELDSGWDEVPDKLTKQYNGYTPPSEKAIQRIDKNEETNKHSTDSVDRKSVV